MESVKGILVLLCVSDWEVEVRDEWGIEKIY